MSGKPTKKSKLIPSSAGQCVWVNAGVISYRLCTLNYECERCSLHQALIDRPVLVPPGAFLAPNRVEIEERRAEFEEFLKTLPASARKCRYMLTGDISYKLCINSFKCATCSFGQMMEDSVAAAETYSADDLQTIAGLRFPHGVHHHRSHTWVRVERDGNVRMGLDDFAQWLLGSVQDVRLPGPGEAVFESVPACEICLNAGLVGVLAPVSGRVIAINNRLLEQPGLINESPYTDGWLIMVEPSDLPCDMASLLYGEEAIRWIEREVERIMKKIKRDRFQVSLVELDKNATWREGLIEEMTGEFLFAKLEKAA
jgi:glycine cleavage system H lipoate-binding protein